MSKLYFVTGNQKKYQELKKIAEADQIELDIYRFKIYELQTDDVKELIKKKACEAFEEIRRPLIVEHTMLKLDAFHQLPGPQTNYIYSKLGYFTILEFCRYKEQFGAYAVSVICYCDGKKYVTAGARQRGRIKQDVDLKRDTYDWDLIFEADFDETESDAEGKQKKGRSMRERAWAGLKAKLGQDFLEEYRIRQSWRAQEDVEPEEVLEELAGLIQQRKVMLFIGAGISKSVDMPLWNELIGALLGEEYDAELLGAYGDHLMLAEFIRQQKSQDAVYDKLREIFHIDTEMLGRLQQSPIYKMIADLECPVIYTTNYDRLIEQYYEITKRPYSRVVHIKDMYRLNPDAVRIMKFHGDLEDKDSIVLAESEYFQRMDFQHFMDVQLQADMLRYHILFLGYSLSDINIKMLLYMARKRQESDCTMKSFIFTATPNQIQKSVFSNHKIVTFSGKDADKAQGTEKFLKTLSKLVNN